MRYLTSGALFLVIVGAINWLFVGLFRFDLVATLTGDEFGKKNPVSSSVYSLVGLAGVAVIPHLIRELNGVNETTDKRSATARR
jgi:uncharacterized membrane protein YuzA (DUF378 family)